MEVRAGRSDGHGGLRQATWRLVDLYAWLDYLTPRLLAPDGPIRGIGVNEQRNTITVVAESQERVPAEALLARTPVPCNLIDLEGG